MSSYLPNIPQQSDNLDFSQGQLLTNFQSLDTYYGIDHIKYSVATNSGFHNQVTSVPQSVVPTTTVNPIFYSYQSTVNTGPLQYSKGYNNAVPTPITTLQSPNAAITLAPGASTNILDFTGITYAQFMIYSFGGFGTIAGVVVIGTWNGASFTLTNVSAIAGGIQPTPTASGNILTLKNNGASAMNNVYWTLSFLRLTP